MEDGTVNFFDVNQELAMNLKGAKCSSRAVEGGCIDGLLLHNNGLPLVNCSEGMTIGALWPFVEAPKMKIRFSHGKFHLF